MRKRLCEVFISIVIAGILYTGCGEVWAQNPTCPTRPFGDSTNACASTAFVQGAIAGTGTPSQIITAAGPVVVAPTDTLILINKSVQSDTPFTLPTLLSRNYLPLTIVDYSGNGGSITFTLPGTEKINTSATFGATSVGPGYPFRLELHPFTGIGWTAQ